MRPDSYVATLLAAFVVLGGLAAPDTRAATCSCAGVPLLGAMQSAGSEGRYYIGAGWEYRDLSDLVAGSSDVPDETGRDRSSTAFVLEGAARLSERWSVAGIGTWLEHERRVGAGPATHGRGLGDAVVMLRWSPLSSGLTQPYGLAVGVGARVPLGDDDDTAAGLTLAEDLQPSTGAWGTVLTVHASRALNRSGAWTAYANFGAAWNEENDRDYQFGDNMTFAAGAAYRGLPRWGFGLELRHRRADRDARSGTSIPNTGGRWLDAQISAQYQFSERFAARASYLVPLRRDLNDALQFTTSRGISFGLAYSL